MSTPAISPEPAPAYVNRRGHHHRSRHAFAVRLLRLDQKIVSGVPMPLKRVANILNTDTMLFQEF